MSLGDEGTDVGGAGQTRTRLPGGDGGVYGSPRRPARSSSRSLVTVVGVIVLLIAAIAFANRGGDGGSAGKETRAGGPGAAAPTAPTGKNPVSSGFAHDRQGAQSAAANYAVALGSDGMYDAARRAEIVRTVYASNVATARQKDLDQVYSDPEFLSRIGLDKNGAAPAGQMFVSRFTPVGSKVEKFSGDAATVSVWYSALFGLTGENSKNPVTESWYTSTFQLKWTDGDWKIVDFTQKDGPAPVGRDQTASTSKEMADAVEQFGGFTYAR